MLDRRNTASVIEVAGSIEDKSADRIARIIRPEIRELQAYQVPSAQGYVKLDAMENPYPLPLKFKQQWLDHLSRAEFNRYPDASAVDLKSKLRQVFHVDDDFEILLGNGSDEIIQIIQMATAVDQVVLAPTPTFVMYEMIARYVGAKFVGVPLGQNFQLDLAATLAAIREYQPAVVFIAHPNNPTGNTFDLDSLEKIIRSAEGLVVMDEAYHPFAQHSFLHHVGGYPNLLVMRTLSKLGLAGLRLGYAVAGPGWIHELEKVRLPYNINVLTQLSADFALSHIETFDEQANKVKNERQRVFSGLLELGYHCYPSDANFILFRCKGNADHVFETLLGNKVLIKNFHGGHAAAMDNCLRVTVGTPEENDLFLNVIAQI